MEDKKKNEASTPDTPKSDSGTGKGRKSQHRKKKGGKPTTVVLSSYMSIMEEIKIYIFTTGLAMNKTFIMSQEKVPGYATIKFGNDVAYSLNQRRVELMHTKVLPSENCRATPCEQNLYLFLRAKIMR